MPAPAAQATPKQLAPIIRRRLCAELLQISRKVASADARRDEIKSVLKADAGQGGENWQETITGLGKVKVSAPKPKRCTGTAPELVVETYLHLPERERDKLTEHGVVKIVEQWKNAYYGAVDVDLF